MSPPQTSRWRKRCWRCLRALRITVVLLLFFIVAACVYLNEVGLPGFLKTPLLKKLHDRGIDLQFSRMKWHLNRGFVAEDVRFESTEAGEPNPRLTIKEVELKLDHSALLKFQVVVDSLILHSGKLVWPVGETNGRPVDLSLTNIQAQLRFLPGDQWELDHFTAAFGGGRLHFSGSVTNASALRDWKLFQGGGGPPELARQRLRQLADTMGQIHFRETPDLVVALNGDGRDAQSFEGLLTVNAHDARTRWGNLTNGTLVARLRPPDATNRFSQVAVELRTGSAATPWGWAANSVLTAKLTAPDFTNYGAHVAFDLRADDAGTPWGGGRNFQMSVRGTREENQTNAIRATMEIQADHFTNEWAQTEKARLTIRWTHELTNAIPLKGTVKLSLEKVQTRWVSAGALELTTRMDTPAIADPLPVDESWAWWAKLKPYTMNWNCELKEIHSAEQTNAEAFELKELACSGLWHAPQLTVTNLSAELYGGHFAVQALMDVATRMVTFTAVSDFDVQKITPFLPEKSRDWLHKFSWEDPPIAHATGGVVLPAWTNRAPDWENEVYPTLWMQGDFKSGQAAYLGIPVNSVQSHFSLTNVIWNLPDLLATRPEGTLELAHTSDDRRDVFYFHIRSSIDPKILRPLLDADGQEGMDDFVFTGPPKVDGEIRGHWHDNSSVGFQAHMSVTNLTFRHETASSFVGDFSYTNRFMVLLNGRIERGTRYMTATGLGVDFPGQRLFLTNGYSTMEQTPVVHAISKKVTQIIEPYQFLQPPIVHAYGTIPLVDEVPADLHFKVEGGPFRWQRFNLNHVAGEVNWVGDHMTLTNARAAFYKGDLTGSAAFNFAVDPGTDMAFDLTVTNADLHTMIMDLRAATNHLEGLLSGHLKVTHANSDDWKSWFGSGEASLHDGLIWDIPIFGRFSPFLDKVHQGMGESRASEGSGTFVINNSIIHSEDLEIRSPTLRLRYRGNVDFDGNIDSYMKAEVFRDVPFGGIISTALLPFSDLFDSKVTGTLSDPKVAPRFLVSKILLAPFHPFRTLSDMFGPSTNTYAAPVFQPPPSSQTPPPATQPPPSSPAPQPSPPARTP